MNVQRRSLATSSTDLRCLQHISTSTSDLTLTKDSETQTENGELDQREEDASSQTDTESTDSEVEEEDAAETGEMTDARADVGSGADTTPDVTGQSGRYAVALRSLQVRSRHDQETKLVNERNSERMQKLGEQTKERKSTNLNERTNERINQYRQRLA